MKEQLNEGEKKQLDEILKEQLNEGKKKQLDEILKEQLNEGEKKQLDEGEKKQLTAQPSGGMKQFSCKIAITVGKHVSNLTLRNVLNKIVKVSP